MRLFQPPQGRAIRRTEWVTIERLSGLVIAAAAMTGCAQPPYSHIDTRDMDTSFLRLHAETYGFSAGLPTSMEITPDGGAVVFLRSGPRDVVRNLYEMNTADGTVREVVRVADLLGGSDEKLTDEEKARRERMREIGRGFTWFKMSEDGSKLLVSLSGRLYVVNRVDGTAIVLPESGAGPAMDARFSPDGRFVSCVRDYDVYVTDLATRTERAVTTGGTEDVSNGVAEFVAQEEMHRFTGYWWSGDARWIAFEEVDNREVETLYIADPRRPEQPPRGWRYPRAGKNNARTRLGIVPVTGGAATWVEWDREKYPYIASVHWGKDAPLTVYVQTREQREAVLYRVDPETGRVSELLRETDSAWINIDGDMPRWLAAGQEFLWTSERSGEWELELRGRDGSLKRTLRPAGARLFGVVSVQPERREVIVSGAEDPTQKHVYRVSLDTGAMTRLTEGVGVHGGHFAKDGSAWVHTASMLDGRISYELKKRDAATGRALPSSAEAPPFSANVELTTVDAGGRTYHAAVIRPRNFDRSRKYPVLDYVYGGPGHPVVSASGRAYLRQQWFADQGFVVVMIDGRGTPLRGRAWERATAWNLIDIPLSDQAEAIQALGAKYAEMDMTRVGIYGWSFGGYFAAMAVCRRPDVFHAAVAGAPVIDWEDYDTHYTERYMGLPQANPEGYRACNVRTYAGDLKRPLMLIHGTTDDNVYFTHTLKMAEALFRAGKEYDLLVLAGFTHMVPEPEVTIRLYERIARFFKTQLGS
ncbi:MAG: peptidase [Planctomycetota bacterium]|nr:MAG: peptidase [Planctomycetota bacterium]